MFKNYKFIFGGVLIIFLTGCVGATVPSIPNVKPMPDAELSQNKQPPVNNYNRMLPLKEGSLWTDAGNYLFENKKAIRVGETIIVDIVENSTSSIGGGTTTSKSRNINVEIPNLAEYMEFPKKKDDKDLDKENLINTTYGTTFGGKGAVGRNGSITATVAVRITGVFPNGNLSIFDQRELKVNKEVQYITVSGIIRPEDIDSTNRIKSTYIADAQIEYSGEGVIADKQKVVAANRILSNFWPF